jgi:hypothetical protein
MCYESSRLKFISERFPDNQKEIICMGLSDWVGQPIVGQGKFYCGVWAATAGY